MAAPTIGGTSVTPASWAEAGASGLQSISTGTTVAPQGFSQEQAKAALADIKQQQEQTQQQGIKSLQQFEQANPQQQNQFLNQIKPQDVSAQAKAADQAQMAAALGVGATGVPASVAATYASGQAFREKRAEQVERGAKGTDVTYREGVKSPLYSENVAKAETKGGSAFVGGVGTFKFAPPITGNNIVEQKAAKEQLFSPIQPSSTEKFSAQGETVFGGMSSVKGMEVKFVANAPLTSVEPSKSEYGYSTYYQPTQGKREAAIFTPALQQVQAGEGKSVQLEIDKFNQMQTKREFEAAKAQGVIGGMSLASGGAIQFIQNQPQEQRKSIFDFGESQAQYGNKAFREAASGAAGYGAERLVSLYEIVAPPLKYVPKSANLPFLGEISPKTLTSSMVSGAVLISPFGQGEVVGTSVTGTPQQKQQLAFEIVTLSAFGVGVGKIFGTGAKAQAPRTVETTGLLGNLRITPSEDIAQTFRIKADETSGFKIQTTTASKISDIIEVGGKPRENIAIGEARLVTTQTPFSKITGERFYVTESMKETNILGAQRIIAGREAIPIENLPQRAMGTREVTLFQRVPESGIFTPSYITKMSSVKTGAGVEVIISKGKSTIGGSLTEPTGAQSAFGITQKGTQIFAFDEFGRMMGTSEVPIAIRQEPSIKFKPEFKEVPKGSLLTGFSISETLPAKTAEKLPLESNIKFESGGEAFFKTYRPSEAPYKISDLTQTTTAGTQLKYVPRAYDKPISLSDIASATETTSRMVAKPKEIPTGIGGKTIDLTKFTSEIASQTGNQFGRYAPTKQGQYQFTKTTQKEKQEISLLSGQIFKQADMIKQKETQGQIPMQATGIAQIGGQIEKQVPIQIQKQSTIQRQMLGTEPPSTPFPQSPIKERQFIPNRPPFELGGLMPDMSGDLGFGGKTKKPKGKYQPSFIALQLGITGGKAEKALKVKSTGLLGGKAKIKGGAGFAEASGFTIRPIIEKKKKK